LRPVDDRAPGRLASRVLRFFRVLDGYRVEIIERAAA
jgi:hypothetical protein